MKKIFYNIVIISGCIAMSTGLVLLVPIVVPLFIQLLDYIYADNGKGLVSIFIITFIIWISGIIYFYLEDRKNGKI
jgi:hypothetical protein